MDYTTIDKAREIFIAHRSTEILNDPMEFSKVVLRCVENHPFKAGENFLRCYKERVSSVADMKDMIEKEVDSLCQEEWFGKSLRVAA